MVDQWGFKWVLGIGQCFKIFSIFMLYRFQVLNPKSDNWIGRILWDIGVGEVWQQSNDRIVRNE